DSSKEQVRRRTLSPSVSRSSARRALVVDFPVICKERRIMRGHRDVLRRIGGRMLVVGLFLLPLGCGSSPGTISGKVFYNGRVVPGGTIMFVAEGNGGSVTTPIKEDGSYRAVKVPPGLAKFALRPHPPPPARNPIGDKSAILAGNDPSKTAKQSEPTKPKE